jgi:adenylosuccinate synthase
MLDIDFGTYPFVTSSNTGIGGVCTGLGISPRHIHNVIGVVKAYTTRVGAGPFPTELLDSVGEHLQNVGHEYGTTTGRKRRCGWLDIVVLKYSHMINDYTSINLTKLDVLDSLDEIKIGVGYRYEGKLLESFPGEKYTSLMKADLSLLSKVTVDYETVKGWKCDISSIRSYDKLPAEAKAYIERIEVLLGVPVSWIGVGPGRDAMIRAK